MRGDLDNPGESFARRLGSIDAVVIHMVGIFSDDFGNGQFGGPLTAGLELWFIFWSAFLLDFEKFLVGIECGGIAGYIESVWTM